MPSNLVGSLFSFNLYYIPVYMYYPIIEKSFIPDTNWIFQFSSVAQSCLTLLRPHGLQHARPPCPLPTLGVYANSCLLNRRCHPTISSSVIPFSSCLQSFPASESSPMSQFFASYGQSIGISVSASVLPMTISLGLTDLISLQSKGL